MATEDSTKTQRTFTILIDLPGVNWHQSSVGFIYTLGHMLDEIKRIDPYEQDDTDVHRRLTVFITAFDLITDQLSERFYFDTPYHKALDKAVTRAIGDVDELSHQGGSS